MEAAKACGRFYLIIFLPLLYEQITKNSMLLERGTLHLSEMHHSDFHVPRESLDRQHILGSRAN